MSGFEWLPGPVRTLLRRYRHAPRLRAQREALRSLSVAPAKRIIIGSSGTRFDGWIATDRDVLDLLREDTWMSYFPHDSLDAILAEHVWEHLTADGAFTAAQVCRRFLKPGGYLRVAVPDGFHPDPAYVASVRPGGSGSGAMDHKVLYDYVSFRKLFADAGFEVRLREYFDERGEFHFDEWDPQDGMIQRSKRFDERNSAAQLAYTSVILDAFKPLKGAGR